MRGRRDRLGSERMDGGQLLVKHTLLVLMLVAPSNAPSAPAQSPCYGENTGPDIYNQLSWCGNPFIAVKFVAPSSMMVSDVEFWIGGAGLAFMSLWTADASTGLPGSKLAETSHSLQVNIDWQGGPFLTAVPLYAQNEYWIAVTAGYCFEGLLATPKCFTGQLYTFANGGSWTPPIQSNLRHFKFRVLGSCPGATTAYCTAKTNSAGCVPSVVSYGTPVAGAASGFQIEARSVIDNRPGLLFYSTNGKAAIPFQGALLCITPPVRRTWVQDSAGTPPCCGFYDIDFNQYMATGEDPSLTTGVTVQAQYWSRDPAASYGTSLTDALEFTIQ